MDSRLPEYQPQNDRQKAFARVIKVAASQSARGISYTVALLGIAALIPGLQLPPELGAIAGGIGIEAMGNILDRVASNSLSSKEIQNELQSLLENSGLDQLLTKEDFYHGFAHLRKKQQTIIKQNQAIFDTLRSLEEGPRKAERFDTATIRNLLDQAFDDEELVYFCFDYFSDAYLYLLPSMKKSQKVQIIIQHCEREGRFPSLLAAIERERPFEYLASYYGEQSFGADANAEQTTVLRNPRQVFVSHANQDHDFALRLSQDLANEGFPVWLAPESIRPGEKWIEAINRGLDVSGIYLVLLTPDSVRSYWVKGETEIALRAERQGLLRFLPLLVRPCEIPPLWGAYQWLPVSEVDYEKGVKELLHLLVLPDKQARHSLYILDESGQLLQGTKTLKRIVLPFDGCTFCSSPCEYFGTIRPVTSNENLLEPLYTAVRYFEERPGPEHWPENWKHVASACLAAAEKVGQSEYLDAAYCFLVQYIDFPFTKHMRQQFEIAFETLQNEVNPSR